jgi:hypothetical protein
MKLCPKLGYLPLVIASLGMSVSHGDVALENVSGLAYMDMGQLVSARAGSKTFEGYYLNRFGVQINVADTIAERLAIKLGIGGLFWQPFPTDPKAFHKNNIRFGPGITEASAEYSFEKPVQIKGGYFDYKYTPATNLGEYLIRTESYPTVLRTGTDWTWVDSAYSRTLGARVRWDLLNGMVRQEFGIFLENRGAPMFDMTPTYLLTFKPVNGFEVGGGVAFRRWIPASGTKDPNSQISRGTDPFEQYVKFNNFPEVQFQADVVYSTPSGEQTALGVWRPGQSFDEAAFLAAHPGATAVVSTTVVQEGSVAGSRKGIKGYLENLTHCDADGTNCQTYLNAEEVAVVDGNGAWVSDSTQAASYSREKISNKAINVMARFTADLTTLFTLPEAWGPFRVYGEIAVLGLEGQPVYYEKMTDRMPVMLGVNIPTFGLLDLLSVEGEYCRNPYPNSNYFAVYGAQPVLKPDGLNEDLKIFRRPSQHSDDVNWSVQATRSLIGGVQLKVQVANDHMRLLDWQPDYETYDAVVSARNDWYYLAHLQWGF